MVLLVMIIEILFFKSNCKGDYPQGYVELGPRCGTDWEGQYKTHMVYDKSHDFIGECIMKDI